MPTKQQLADHWVNFLTSEGYPCNIDADGDVTFRCEGYTYFILISDDDPDYFRLVFPNIWSIDDEAERARVIAAADHASAATKVAKVFTVGNNVWVAAELLAESHDEVKPFFGRLIRTLRAAAATFAAKLQG